MDFGAFFERHRRLLLLCGLSLLLHAFTIAYFDAWIVPSPAPIGTPRLAIRLVQPSAAPAGAARAAVPVSAQAVQDPAPAPELSENAKPSVPAGQPAAEPVPPMAAEPATVAAGGGEPFQMPSRYRVAMPPAVTIAYELREASGAAGQAALRWETDGVQYRLELDGVLGRIESEGASDDAGIAPQRASYRIGAGSAAVVFERERRAIVFEGFRRSAQDRPGSQDGATVLMQLTGIGLADPDQMQDTVDIHVARADGAAVERFRVIGREQLATALGSIEALHLVRGGSERLEVWLAPARGWLPVQLRTTAPDGTVRTQVVNEIRSAPPE